MSQGHERSRRQSGSDPAARGGADGGTPGKTTLVEQLQASDVHRAAERGVQGGHQSLPHLDAIQRSFGHHAVHDVRAFVGGTAESASHEMGAQAYAVGDAVAFARSPDLHTAAHEAAHVVQQRAGVQLLGGVGQDGDTYEHHANAVADLVVQGRSAEAALDQLAPAGGGHARATQHKAVQRAPLRTHYGEFKAEHYAEVARDGSNEGVELYLKFTPNAEVDATKIGLTQSVKNYVAGTPIATDVTKESQQVKTGAGKGYYVDQLAENRNPLFATDAEPAANSDHLESYDTPRHVRPLTRTENAANARAHVTGRKYEGWGEHGFRKKEGADWKTKDAELRDTPNLPVKKANSGKLFETAAVAIEGTQNGTYYGSVSWGMTTNAAGDLSKVELTKGSDAVPTQNFMAAAKQWNASAARGTRVAAADNTQVFDEAMTEKFKLKKDVKLEVQQEAMIQGAVMLFVKVDAADPDHAGRTGYVKLAGVKDKGDGKAVVKLPYVDVKLTSAAVKLYKAADRKDVIVELPKETRLRVLTSAGDLLQIEVVDGAQTAKTGWIDKGRIKDEA